MSIETARKIREALRRILYPEDYHNIVRSMCIKSMEMDEGGCF
jgi:hypothetical protein